MYIVALALILATTSRPTSRSSSPASPEHIKPYHNARSLVGIRKVGLVVFSMAFTRDSRLDQQAAIDGRTVAELELRKISLAFEAEAAAEGNDWRTATFATINKHVLPTVILTISGNPEDGYTSEIEMVETATVARNPELTVNAKTWLGKGYIKIPGGAKESVLQAARVAITDFCNEYLKANPKE